MKFLIKSFSIIATLCFALTILPSVKAEAGRYGIVCKGQFQLVNGRWISTPPCEEAVIAKVARSYGYRYSTADVRNGALNKVAICHSFGNDIRLSGICGAYSGRRTQ